MVARQAPPRHPSQQVGQIHRAWGGVEGGGNDLPYNNVKFTELPNCASSKACARFLMKKGSMGNSALKGCRAGKGACSGRAGEVTAEGM